MMIRGEKGGQNKRMRQTTKRSKKKQEERTQMKERRGKEAEKNTGNNMRD